MSDLIGGKSFFQKKSFTMADKTYRKPVLPSYNLVNLCSVILGKRSWPYQLPSDELWGMNQIDPTLVFIYEFHLVVDF